MSGSDGGTTGRAGFRPGSGLVLVAAVLLGLSSLYVIAVPIDPSFFEDRTGLVYDDFAASEPAIAELLERNSRLLGVASVAASLFALALTWMHVRRGDRTATRVAWVLPGLLAAWTLLFLVDGVTLLVVYYGALTLVAAAGLVLVERSLAAGARASDPTPVGTA